jgi:hypothetical protein
MITQEEMDKMDENTTLFPTFKCFDDAMEFIDHIARNCKDIAERIYLVHAICVTEEGEEYAHAWVEDMEQDVAIFAAS